MRKGKYRHELALTSGHDFAAKVESLLSAILPNVSQSKKLGELDREGIDVYQYEPECYGVTLAVQCKGFEKDWQTSRLKDIDKEIAKFIAKADSVDAYWLVLNRSIPKPEDRAAIDAGLHKIVAAGKAKSARLLDLGQFVKEIGERSFEKFSALSKTSRESQAATYRERLAAIDYLPEVPFLAEETAARDVTSHILSTIKAHIDAAPEGQTGRYRKPPRYLLTGGFGFGKTLGLHTLGELWAQQDQSVFYFPAAAISDEAFVNSSGLLADVMRQIVDEDLGSNDLAMGFLQDCCKHAFRTTYPLLLIDAIDESRFWHEPDRLEMLWASVDELGIPVIVTVRDELYDSRPIDFDPTGDFFRHLRLTDWDPVLMTRFLDRFAAGKGAPSATFQRLRDDVALGQYEARYGDIPRRPLFLGMLAEDAWRGDDPERDLSRLYGKYFRLKLQRDWTRSVTNMPTMRGRVIAQRYGKEEAAEALLRLMQEIALSMHGKRRDSSAPGGLNFEEELLRTVSAKTIGAIDRIEDVLLISLVQPSGRDPKTRNRLYRFAHKSFHDWFLARGLVCNGLSGEEEGLSPAVRQFAAQMRDALLAGGELP